MTIKRWTAAILLGLVAALLLLWLARAQIAARFAQNYFSSHGIESSVEIGTLGLSGGSGRFALGPRDNPTISADSIELFFDPLSWIPRVVEVRLVGPVVRARLDESGKVRLEALQDWIDSLQQQQGKSRFVSDDLAVSLTGLRVLLTTPSGPWAAAGLKNSGRQNGRMPLAFHALRPSGLVRNLMKSIASLGLALRLETASTASM